jgi:hydroxypyruvate isomerase
MPPEAGPPCSSLPAAQGYLARVPNLAANISTMFNEHDFATRIDAAAACGFSAVECQFPYATPAEEVADRLRKTGVELVLLNAPAGDLAAGDRGLGAVDGRHEEFMASIETAARYAEITGCRRIHVMAGCPVDGGASQRFVDRIGWAADRLAPAGIDVLIEPMNLRDVPGYLLMSTRQAERVIDNVARANVKLQFDTYHLQIQEGDLVANFLRCQEKIGHLQCSSLPGRNEPDSGEVAHQWLFERFDDAGYGDWIGCEYRPRGATLDGLDWAEPYGIVARPL